MRYLFKFYEKYVVDPTTVSARNWQNPNFWKIITFELLELLCGSPHTSTRTAALTLNMSQSTIVRIRGDCSVHGTHVRCTFYTLDHELRP